MKRKKKTVNKYNLTRELTTARGWGWKTDDGGKEKSGSSGMQLGLGTSRRVHYPLTRLAQIAAVSFFLPLQSVL